ncbi:MAG: 16S rRNA (cytosine(967)-C(5))-methyltransferase RsmB, partial [Mogibacterium sp.]|nr:16S rRNA (cytosine(967)-C(5))-methyltransferase RsmB [Mogibacterium sp.]
YTAAGGRIEYSTCTLNKDENERLVSSVVKAYSFVSIVEMRTILPYNCSVGFFYCILDKKA